MNKNIIIIILFAFVLRLGAVILLGRNINPEIWEYDNIAVNLIQQKGYSISHLNTIYRSFGYPVYPILSAVFHTLTNRNYFILEIFQTIISAMVCYFIYSIATKIFDKKTGLLSAFLVALHPGLIIYSTKIHELTVFTFFMVALLWFIFYLDWSKFYNNIFIGIFIGIGTLIRPEFIFLLPSYFIYLALSFTGSRSIFRVMSIVSLCAILAILPWAIRNYNIHKRWIFITTNSAEHFWRGNNLSATGSALTKDGRSILSDAPIQFKEQLYRMSEIKQYDFFWKEALKFIKSSPTHFIKITFNKFIYFWWFSPSAGRFYPYPWVVIYRIYYFFLLILFVLGCIIGIFKFNKNSKSATISLMVLLVLFSFLHSLFYIETRHRWAVEHFMIIFSSLALSYIYDGFKNITT